MRDTDLLVVGAGPVGLTLACEALRHGLRPRVIDLQEGPSIYSKAQIVHARTLEMLEKMGIADRFVARGIPIHSFEVFVEGGKKRLVHLAVGGLDSRYQGMLSISQRDTEQLLLDQLEALGGLVERRVRLTELAQHEDGVVATLAHEEDGRTESVTVPWLAGCDGAHSTVRKALGLEFEGDRYPMEILQTDARVDFPFRVHDDQVMAFIGTGEVAGFFPLPGGEHRYRFLVPLGGGESPAFGKMEEEPPLERFQQVLDRLVPGAKVSDPAWRVGFRIHCRLAERFRVGRAFLLGDAAHIHSPAGGQGMNMGMQDAHDLAWKLALYHRGEGTERLLASYEIERRGVARETLDWTDRATKGALFNLGLKNELAVGTRNQLAGFVANLGLVQHRVVRMMSMLEVRYTDSPISGEHRGSMLDADVMGSEASENPSVRSWIAFGGGPGPGERAPDAQLDPEEGDASPRLHQLLDGTGFTILLFDGAAPTKEGYLRFAALEARLHARFGDRVRVHIVLPLAGRPAGLPIERKVVLDGRRTYHEAFGAQTECLYAIRPDGYVGYRCQPADGDRLVAYLETILT